MTATTLPQQDTRTVEMTALVRTDLVNCMLNLRASSQFHPRMDCFLQATIDYAADAIEALLELDEAQNGPVPS